MITTQAVACSAATSVAAVLVCNTGVDPLTLTCAGTGAWIGAAAFRDLPMWRWMLQFIAAAWLSAVFGTFGAHAAGWAAIPGAAGSMSGLIALLFHPALAAITESMRPMIADLWGALVARVRGPGAAPPKKGGRR